MQNVLAQISRRFRVSNIFFKDIGCDSHVDKTIKEINNELNKAFEAEYVAKKKNIFLGLAGTKKTDSNHVL